MNQEIEQRIVAMYFDNKDFEKGAKQTIDTLQELKDNLNLEDSVKGFEELDKAGKKLNLTSVKQTINGMKNSLGGFSSVLNKAFTIGTAPVRALENFFGTFQSYVGKFVGFDLASKFVNSLESALRQLTIAPVEAGWEMYQANVDSVKTIMSGTLQSYKKQMSEVDSDWTYNEEQHMDFVKGQLRELSNYAQQTVFSLSDMTSNVGKFTNNNIDLKTSVMAMEGIANMAAKAGQGAQQASMAMYNFSQSLGVGKMTSIDWKSIENANMATTELKQLFIDTAVAGGKLTKQVEKLADGKEIVKYFRTVDENGKKLAKNKWVEVSAENFRDTLKEGWLDKQTLLNTMMIYSNKINDVDDLKAMGFDVENEELVKYLMGIGEEAAKAATQVRTFRKMWDAMTEAVQSGWADSMELIFGDMTEATEFWTRINEEIGGVLDASAEERNKMLHEWRGEVYNSEKEIWEKQKGAYDGRKDLLQGIYNIIAAAKALGGTFSSAWREVFGKTDGKQLQEITKRFHELTDEFNRWLGGQKDQNGETRIEKIKKGLKGLFSILKTVGNVFKTLWGVVKKVAAPLADVFINLFGDIAGFFDGLGDLNAGQVIARIREGLEKLWQGIARLFTPEEIEDSLGNKTKGQSPIAKFLATTFGNIKKDVKQWFQENDLSSVWTSIVNVWNWIKETWDKIAAWEGWAAIGAFVTNIFTAIKNYFAPKTHDDRGFKYNTAQDSKFVSDIKRIWSRIKSAWNSVKNWEGWKSIGQFFGDIGGWIEKTYNIVVDFFSKPNASGKTGFSEWLESVGQWFSRIWTPIANWDQWENIGNFFSDIWKWITGKTQDVLGFFQPGENGEDSPFIQFINQIASGISGIWSTISNWSGWEDIKGFFLNIWTWITGTTKDALAWFQPGENGEDSPFIQFVKGIASGISGIWNTVSNWTGWEEIKNFFVNSWNWITGKAQDGLEWFKMGENGEKSGFVQFLESIAADVSRIWGTISNWSGWKSIGEFLSNTWNWIMGFLSGGDDDSKDSSSTKKGFNRNSKLGALKAKAHEAKEAIQGTDKDLSIFERIMKTLSGFIETIGTYLTGQDLTQVNKFFEALGTFFNGLLDIITKVLDSAGKFLSATAEGGIGAGWESLGGETHLTIYISAALGLLGYIIDLVKTKWMSKIDAGESVAHKLAELGVALLAVALALGVISLIPTEKIISGGLVLAAILGALVLVGKSLAEISKQNATTPTERVLTKLIGAVEKMGTIAIVMALIPNIIKAIAEAKNAAPELTGMDIMETLIGVASAIAIILLALGVTEKIIGNAKGNFKNLAVYGKIVLVMVGLVAVITAIGYAANQWIGTKTMIDSLKDAKEVLTLTGEALGGLVGGLIGGLIEPIRRALGYQSNEEKMEEAMTILSSLADRMEYFTPDKISGINRILSSVGMLSETVQSVPDAGKIQNFANSLAPLAHGMIDMGVQLAGFSEDQRGIQGLSIDDVEANILKVADIISAFRIPTDMNMAEATGFIDAIRTLSHEMTNEDFHAFGELVNNFVTEFDNATGPNGDAMTRMSGNLMSNLSEAIRIGLRVGTGTVGSFDAQPVIDAICTALAAGKQRVAAEVHNMVQDGINESPEANGGGGFDLSGIINSDFSNLFHLDGGFGLTNLFSDNPELMLGALGTTLYGEGGTEDNPKKDSIFGMLGGLVNYTDNLEFSSLDESFGKITEKLTFKDEEGNPIDLATYLQDNINKMSESLKNAEETFTITIVPSLDWQNLSADTIRQQLGDMPIDFPTLFNMGDTPMKVDFAGLSTELGMGYIQDELVAIENAIDTERVQVVEAIDRMGVRIDNVSATVSHLKLYLDTGLLVGGITPYVDAALGRRASLAGRTGVSPY